MVTNTLLFMMFIAPCIGIISSLLMNEQTDEKNNNSTYVGLWTTALVLVLSCMLLLGPSPVQYIEYTDIISGIHSISFFSEQYFDVTRLSTILIILSSLIIYVSLLISLNEITKHRNVFVMLLLSIEALTIVLFSTNDIMIFYVCFEAILIPMFFIIAMNSNCFHVARKYFLLLLFGSLLVLGAVLYLSSVTGTTNIHTIAHFNFSYQESIALFWILFIGLSFKSAIFPFHIWLPDSHTAAPTSASLILSGVYLKVGCYGFIFMLIKIFPEMCLEFTNVVHALLCVSILYGACIACIQDNFKRAIAYSSISHIGVIISGLFSFDSAGVSGAIVQMIAHSVISPGLFILEYATRHNRTDLHNETRIGCLIIALSGISFPLTANFISEVVILRSIINTHMMTAICIVISELLSLYYIFKHYIKIAFIQSKMKESLQKTSCIERIAIQLIAATSVLIFLFSKNLILHIMPYAKYLLIGNP